MIAPCAAWVMKAEQAAQATLTRGYILHTRQYTDSRVLLDLITAESGRVSVVARKAAVKQTGQYMLFQPLLFNWRGASELKTLRVCEPTGEAALRLPGKLAYCGLYLNELLLRVLPLADEQPAIFDTYERCLRCLSRAASLKAAEPMLRSFELDLLQEFGLAFDYGHCCDSGLPISPNGTYQLQIDCGFTAVTVAGGGPQEGIFGGAEILALGRRDFSAEPTLIAAKQIARMALSPLLGGRPLKSRELFL